MIPAHLYGLPPAVIRMRGRREREEERARERALDAAFDDHLSRIGRSLADELAKSRGEIPALPVVN